MLIRLTYSYVEDDNPLTCCQDPLCQMGMRWKDNDSGCHHSSVHSGVSELVNGMISQAPENELTRILIINLSLKLLSFKQFQTFTGSSLSNGKMGG